MRFFFYRVIVQLEILLVLILNFNTWTVLGILREPSIYSKLTRHILEDYDANSGPLLSASDKIQGIFPLVKHDLSLKQIVEIDAKTQTIQLILHEYMSWVDEYLAWDKEHFHNISSITLRRERLWLPDVFVINQIGKDNYYMRENLVPVSVNNRGHVYLDTPLCVNVFCKLQMADFPFDVQQCDILVGSWTRDSSQLEVSNSHKRPCLDTAKFRINSEWHLEGVGCEEGATTTALITPLRTGEGQGGREDRNGSEMGSSISFSRVRYSVVVSRRSAFYTRVIIMPTVMMSFLSTLVFLLPNEDKEKVNFIMSLFLTQVFNVVLISGFVPINSVQVPVITQYCFLSTFITWFCLLFSVIALAAHHSPDWFDYFSYEHQYNIYHLFSAAAKYLLVPVPRVNKLPHHSRNSKFIEMDSKLNTAKILSESNLKCFEKFRQLESQIAEVEKQLTQIDIVNAVLTEAKVEMWRFCLKCVDRIVSVLFLAVNLVALKLVLPFYMP
ncbi:neuronal acetylcholine receptor subunit beta-3-like [Convolutriloba macropyga]|uniref:neuronal acetylcholine receptor subunit beta-3-like n=1 Tax=Convolutriloba macropyga TaxID=536237 RepID=UPI003F5271AC